MVIETREFGFIEIKEEDILKFPNGIYGFEDIKEYVILKQNDEPDSPVMWMQAVRNMHIRFIILDPLSVVDEYKPDIPESLFEELGAKSIEMLRLFVIAVVPKDIKDMTVNLKSPIVVNIENNTAAQVVLENPEYPVRHFVFKRSEVAI
jgi:flagellar assembly factor FliW